jgi:branched-chain amino acid aminotransferase
MTAWHFFEGKWQEGNPGIMGPMTHGSWLASTVFDGARAFEGVAPDLDLHCRRIVASAKTMGLNALHSEGELMEFAQEGISKFPKGTALYIKPMYWADDGWVDVDPDTTNFCFSVFESTLPEDIGFSAALSPYRRPSLEMAPTDAKAACHYPNSARALRDARQRGFENAVMLDPLSNVAELATANLFYAKDGEAHTPVPNGCFLNGITRQRCIKLLRDAGITVHERSLTFADFVGADEVFSTGNYGKVLPISRLEEQDLQPGPVYAKCRELYWSWAHGAL